MSSSDAAVHKIPRSKGMPIGVVFDKEYSVVMLIQVTHFEGTVWREVSETANQILKLYDIEDHFFGPSFGRFNYTVEFFHSSALVASNIVSEIQDGLKSSLKQINGEIEVCSSAILGTEVIGNPRVSRGFEQPIRAYTFIKPRSGSLIPFIEAVETLNLEDPKNTKMRIFWTHGIHWIAVSSGPCFEEITEKLERFRMIAEKSYVDTSTIISLNNKDGHFFDGLDSVNENHTHNSKYAIVYVKHSGARDLKVGNLKPLALFPGLSSQLKRLGGLDTVFIFREDSLGNIMSDIRTLRDLNNGRIFHTNTVLIYE